MRGTDSMCSWKIMIFKWDMCCNNYYGLHPRWKTIVDDVFLLENGEKRTAWVKRMISDLWEYYGRFPLPPLRLPHGTFRFLGRVERRIYSRVAGYSHPLSVSRDGFCRVRMVQLEYDIL